MTSNNTDVCTKRPHTPTCFSVRITWSSVTQVILYALKSNYVSISSSSNYINNLQLYGTITVKLIPLNLFCFLIHILNYYLRLKLCSPHLISIDCLQDCSNVYENLSVYLSPPTSFVSLCIHPPRIRLLIRTAMTFITLKENSQHQNIIHHVTEVKGRFENNKCVLTSSNCVFYSILTSLAPYFSSLLSRALFTSHSKYYSFYSSYWFNAFN